MKWHDSVKVKMLGFFIVISIVFLISIIVIFFFMRDKHLQENATDASNLATSFILQYITIKQTQAEEIVLSLASVTQKEFDRHSNNINKLVIPSILDTDKENRIDIVSGGVWFEPYAIDKNIKDYFLFYNRDKHGKFILIKDYKKKADKDLEELEFYKIAKTIKAGEVTWTNVYKDPVTHINMMTAVSPIYKNGQFIGTASLDIQIGIKNEQFWHDIKEKNMYLMMIDKDGNFIGYSEKLKPLIDTTNIFTSNNPKLRPMANKIKPFLTNDIQHNKTIEKKFLNKIYLLENDPIFDDESVVSVYHFKNTHWSIIIGILKSQVMAQNNQIFMSVLTLIILLTILATILGYIALQKLFVYPIESINKQLKNNINKEGKAYTLLECEDKGEIGLLVENLNNRTEALTESQNREEKEIIKNMKSEKMLLQQSKMAAMGEMMDAVAHQWKQPLNALSMYSEVIKSDFDEGNVDKAYIDKFRDDIQVQIDHMVNTLDEFRTFFRPNKENEMFSLLSIVHSVLFLTKDDLLKNRITVNIEQKDHIDIDGSANEFKHLVLNIINNAKDAFNENHIEKRIIHIRIINDDEGKRMEIEDNAGGIPAEILDEIFKANITSKKEGKGTGIGLYMSTQIATKHHATLSVKNANEGACFTVTFNS